MESACLRHTDIPNTSRLFSDFQYNFDRVGKYYHYWPGYPSSYHEAASKIDYPDDRRAALVSALRSRNGNSASLELLAKPGTVAVVTGQQVGLFSGPSYTIYKALSAVRLARTLTEQGQPAVPIFWIATEDHDLAEVNHCFVFSADRQPVKLAAPGSGAPQQPVGTIRLGGAPVAQLRQTLQPFPYGEEISDLVANAYGEGATFGSSFEQLLRQLLGAWDLLFLDPLDLPIRSIAAPFLKEALLREPKLQDRLLARNKELEADGYHAQVHVDAQTSLFFVLDGERRLTSKDRAFKFTNLAAEPERLSPNALLRPVVQDYLLPTVAYIGGPAELAYFAQSQVLYDELLGRMPVVLARSSFTLLDGRARKLMKRYNLGLPCFFHGEDCLREKIAAKIVPAQLTSEFRTVERNTAEALDHLTEGLTAFDPTLAAAMSKSRTKVLYQLSKIKRKTAREALRRDQRATEESQYLTGLIFPEKHLQERYYSILPFLATHGLGLLDTLYESVTLDCPDHKILSI